MSSQRRIPANVVKFEARWWSFWEPTHRLRFASKIRACFGYGADGGNGAVFDFGKDGLASMRVNPGLSAYAEDPESAGGSLRELPEFGKGRVPKDLWAETEIRLMARAGLRLLDLGVQNRILNSCWKVLRSSGFKFRDEWASVITAWLEFNFVPHLFKCPISVAFLRMKCKK
ncbi:probable apyrase 6 isoform X2 [Malus sylvestris]|uniref:probable apyrase 6 isoform X2 n=1 Tax=Malus sylvestris TaxID=3752 RepID=UPI0021AC8751|nr:probable apyrase 6 isoform X2 [Malus sylvestris]